MQNFVVGKQSFRPLNPQEEIFVAEYLSCFDAVKAARKAGFAKSVANVHAREWLKLGGPKPQVARAIRTALQARINRLNITADVVIAELGRLGLSNMGTFFKTTSDGTPFFDFEDLTENDTACIKTLTIEEFKDGRGDDARDVRRVKLELYDKKGPLLALAKHLGVLDGFSGEGDGDGDGKTGGDTINQFNITVVKSGEHFQDGALIEGERIMERLEDHR